LPPRAPPCVSGCDALLVPDHSTPGWLLHIVCPWRFVAVCYPSQCLVVTVGPPAEQSGLVLLERLPLLLDHGRMVCVAGMLFRGPVKPPTIVPQSSKHFLVPAK
jgi:hypothetical protein